MHIKIGSRWLHVAAAFAAMAACYAQPTVPSPELGPSFEISNFLNSTDILMNATTMEVYTDVNVTTNLSTVLITGDFDYDSLNWSTRTTTVETDEYGETTYGTDDVRNATPRIPPIDGISTPLDSKNIVIAFITTGVVLGIFALCYLGTLMNLCICRCFMYECPSGRYAEAPKEVT